MKKQGEDEIFYSFLFRIEQHHSHQGYQDIWYDTDIIRCDKKQPAMRLFDTNNVQTRSQFYLNPGLHSISLPSIYKDFKFISKYQILVLTTNMLHNLTVLAIYMDYH